MIRPQVMAAKVPGNATYTNSGMTTPLLKVAAVENQPATGSPLPSGAVAASCARAGSAAPSARATETPAISLVMVWIIWFPLQRFVAGLAGTDTDDLLQVRDENLAVADFPGAGRGLDGIDDLI